MCWTLQIVSVGIRVAICPLCVKAPLDVGYTTITAIIQLIIVRHWVDRVELTQINISAITGNRDAPIGHTLVSAVTFDMTQIIFSVITGKYFVRDVLV